MSADGMKKKSQVSMEFMVFVGIAVILLAIFTVLVIMFVNNIYLEKEKIMAGRILKDMKGEIAIAGRIGNGYVRMTDIPDNVGGWNYDLYFDERYVFLRMEEAAEQGDFVEGLSAEIENAGPNTPVRFEVKSGERKNRDIVIEKRDNGVYVCSLESFNEKEMCS